VGVCSGFAPPSEVEAFGRVDESPGAGCCGHGCGRASWPDFCLLTPDSLLPYSYPITSLCHTSTSCTAGASRLWRRGQTLVYNAMGTYQWS
jgi:hypothetical protein